MDCPKCKNNWNSSSTVPLVLFCGHSLCRNCCTNEMNDSGVLCPKCSKLASFPLVKDVSKSDSEFYFECTNTLLVNETLLELMTLIERNSCKNRRNFAIGDECEEHKKPIHSYTRKPFSMLCDDCLFEIRDLCLEVIPYPEIVRLTKFTLESATKKFEKGCEFLSQQFNIVREGQLDPIEKELRRKLEEHFNTIKLGLDQTYDTARNQLGRLTAIEESQHQLIREIAVNSLNEVANKEQHIMAMLNMSDTELVERYSEIERLVEDSKKPIDNYKRPEKSIELNFNPNLDIFTQMIKNSFRLSFNPQARREWSCENCGRSNRNGTHQCDCGIFINGGPQIPRST